MENTLERNMSVYITKLVAFNAVIAAWYVVLTMPFTAISYGPVQFRLSEVLTILPIFFPGATVGLTIGCAVSNTISNYGIADVFLGSLTTLAAGVLTSVIRKFPFAHIPPIVLNAFAVPAIMLFFGDETIYWFNVLTVGGGQAAVILGLGIPFYFLIKKNLKHLNFPVLPQKESAGEESN